ncbi:MAG: hypothetical protein U0531_09015 [Dehalococcoidia bacterium]
MQAIVAEVAARGVPITEPDDMTPLRGRGNTGGVAAVACAAGNRRLGAGRGVALDPPTDTERHRHRPAGGGHGPPEPLHRRVQCGRDHAGRSRPAAAGMATAAQSLPDAAIMLTSARLMRPGRRPGG